MKVSLKHIKPNPWRYLNKGYPIDKAKVEKLRASIQRTGFWDNLVARKSKDNGCVEIAYGHHRIEALRHEFKPDHGIEVIIRDIDDGMMLKIMAEENENMDLMSPVVINETVRATRDFLRSNPHIEATLFTKDEMAKRLHGGVKTSSEYWPDAFAVQRFLNWPIHRVHNSMSALKDFESGMVDKGDYESIPHQETANIYRMAIKKNPLSAAQRKPIIEKLKTREIGKRQIAKEILKAKFPTERKSEIIEINDIADQVIKNIRSATILLSDEFIDGSEFMKPDTLSRLSQAANGLLVRLRKMAKVKPLKLETK